jgi:hypothetical protein
MRLALVLALMASPVWAGDKLDAAGIVAALTGKVLGYADGTTQSFKADGETIFVAKDGRQSIGHWRVQADWYCSVWPPSDQWACYGVTQEGGDIAFLADDGSISLGHLKP